MKNSIYIQSILGFKGIGRKKAFKLVNKLHLEKNNISENEFIERVKSVKEFVLFNINIDELKKNIDIEKKNFEEHLSSEINSVAFYEKEFPKKLLAINDPPLILFYKGNIAKLNTIDSIAVVGTREPDKNSYDIANRYSQIISENNFGVVSGLARGCDTAAHKGALEKNAYTVAVMPCSLDDESIYPKENKSLLNDILKNDNCVISEYSLGTKIQQYQFIERDRLQSGLSNSILIIETTLKGGTMHTYKFALEQSKLIGCCNFYDDINRFSGNIEIMSDSNVIKITDHNDLQNFIEQSKINELKLL